MNPFRRARVASAALFGALACVASSTADSEIAGSRMLSVQTNNNAIAGSRPLYGRLILAKIGLENFTPDQQEWFWKKVEFYAQAAAFVQACGHDPNFEQRIVAAAQNCATDAAIQTVRAVFHKKLAANRKLDPPGICKLAGAPDLTANLEKSLEQAIEDVAQACRTCLTC